jgi:branched-subunit amino acid transport protein
MSISLGAIVAMAAVTYALRLVGLALAHRGLRGTSARLLPLLPAALLAGLVVANGLARDGELVVDERVGGMLVAMFLAVRGRGMGAVVVAGVGTTAVLRLARAYLGG